MHTLPLIAKSESLQRSTVCLSEILTGWNSLDEFTYSINVSRLRNLISQPTNVVPFLLE